MNQDEKPLFDDEEINEPLPIEMNVGWKILVVDDEEDVHQVTHFVLDDFVYDNKRLDIFSAYSAHQARAIMQDNHDIAIILLDVVMETDDAGLEFVKYVREEMQNPFVQIILRTGQAGYAPEKEVITRYEINDYKNKTELTEQKLFTAITANLRAYDNLIHLESLRQNLEEKVLIRTHQLHEKNTELLNLNQELVELNHDLTELTEEKNQFLALAATDFKKPLEAIQELSILMQRSISQLAQDKIREFAKIIEVSSQRMTQLIQNLLQANDLETGKLDMPLGIYDVSSSLQFLADDYVEYAREKGIQLQIDLPQEECKLLVNKRALLQVLDNLILNAIKYSPYGKTVFIRFIKNNSIMHCEIQDQGIGISPEEQQKLFGKFSRLSPQPTGDESATGLGLFIVKKLVETMNGEIYCKSDIGKGTTFIVEFPLIEAHYE
ncbi:hybrid sensor histidine kinase/response regulator [Candidatus Albibeggiatoa sp. nov. NOAA]|uniref:ATP-binding response regulator n=1 Tax=Candidatus Albibeggiatoa sp. nov. NOAA TaxID=3162724 RepID=UPI0032FE6EAD|nr:hybrid sensor histidine kinase/response regulator [Thiotrichaceae bacterium]